RIAKVKQTTTNGIDSTWPAAGEEVYVGALAWGLSGAAAIPTRRRRPSRPRPSPRPKTSCWGVFRRMSRSASGADADVVAGDCRRPRVSCEEANELLTRYNVNALLVTAQGEGWEELWGYIAAVIERSFTSSAGCRCASYMNTEVASVGPEADLPRDPEEDHRKQAAHPAGAGRRAHRRGHHAHRPAERAGRPAASRPAAPSNRCATPSTRARRNITRFMQERLPRQVTSRLREIGAVAGRAGLRRLRGGRFRARPLPLPRRRGPRHRDRGRRDRLRARVRAASPGRASTPTRSSARRSSSTRTASRSTSPRRAWSTTSSRPRCRSWK
ncbi:MAG: hypothetical protein MZV70_75855, partial [Desulfobacterales bacterium]|nr:hypothetical protein [Desulfobacterales bacterium]